MKKDMLTWAVKIRGRSLMLNMNGHPMLYPTKAAAERAAQAHSDVMGWRTEPVRVKVRVEEVSWT